MRRLHQNEESREELTLDLDELVARQGARSRMLAEALEAEVQDYLEAARGQSVMNTAAPWWSATATPTSARWAYPG